MNNKKIVSITMVKNECDIIELFIRYNLKFLDEMYIISHMPSDTTLDILIALKNEGLPINLLKYNSYRYDQGKILTAMQQKIKRENKADYIIFMDADEFIYCNSKEDLLKSFINNYRNSFEINQFSYLVKEGYENNNIPLQEKLIFKANHITCKKAILNVNIHRNIIVTEGGHELMQGGSMILLKPVSTAYLAHFPYRSKEQMMSKIFIGCLSYLVISENFKNGGIGIHWFNEYKKNIDNGQIKEMQLPIALISDINNSLYSLAPLNFNEPLKYTDKIKVDALENSINFSIEFIKYNNDESRRDDLIEWVQNLDRVDKEESIKNLIKRMEEYIRESGRCEFNIKNLEEINTNNK